MSNVSRMMPWLIAAVCTFAVIALIAYARGPEHHRGDEVRAHEEGHRGAAGTVIVSMAGWISSVRRLEPHACWGSEALTRIRARRFTRSR